MQLAQPYLLFLGEAPDQLAAKTAQGVLDWRPDWCLGQMRLADCKADLGLPEMTLSDAKTAGVKTMVIGVANRGGVISEAWTALLEEALSMGFDLAAGLHNRLADVPALAAAAEKHGRNLFDLRHPTQSFQVGSGKKRSGKRLLTVGTDCSIGKMYTSLAIEREMQARGMAADFRATGQTGIFITGRGVSVDAVVADFISGAIEWLAPDNDPDHWDVIEGQGSLFHASFAGVSMGLLHGAQPDALVLCHEPTRTHMRGLPTYGLPEIGACMEANLAAGRLTNPAARFVGISVNSSQMAPDAVAPYLRSLEEQFALPVVDSFKDGAGRIVDNL